MTHITIKTLALAAAFAAACPAFARMERVASPDGRLAVEAGENGGMLMWSAERKGAKLVLPSALGLDFIEQGVKGPFKLLEVRRRTIDSAWTTRFYRKEKVVDRANEMTLSFEGEGGGRIDVVVRAYDDGFAFRYVVPEQKGFEGFQVKAELTEWRLAPGAEGWITSYKTFLTSQECEFKRRKVREISPKEILGMPAVVEANGQWMALCEADLTDWAGLFYRVPAKGQPADAAVLSAALAPLPPSSAAAAGVAVIRETPAASPWRVAICGDTLLDLAAAGADIVMNLNPPPEGDFSWVVPGASSWDWWVDSNNSLSTELTLKLVDFAAEMGWKYHTIDGGWYGWARRPNHGPHVSVEPRKTFDLKRVVEHAKEKGVGIFVWLHWEAVEDNGVEETFAKLAGWGVKGVKIDFLDRSDQKIVRWCERVVRAAAKNKILVNFHGMYKPTGMNRTWPNQINREGIMGNEMCKFNAQITPVHTATLPFTRYLLGPADFTPGSFGNVHFKDFTPQSQRGHRYGDETDHRPIWAEEIGTRAHALALCFAYDSPLLTLCDWPERYRGAPGAEALKNPPTVWRSTIPLAGAPASHYAVAREAFDGCFYLAALTVEARRLELPLPFLGEGEYEAEFFLDDPVRTPTYAAAISVSRRAVRGGGTLSLDLCAEGGALVIFTKKH
jgi:alpha-glucosidase